MAGTSFLRTRLPYRNFNAAFILIGVNLFVFFVNQIAPQTILYLAMNPMAVVDRGLIWQPFTYMFAHAGITHILFNMLGIFFFGTQVEARLGSYEFLLFYGLTGLLAGLFSLGFYLMTGNVNVILLGASGAVFAVLLAFATLFPDAVIFLFGIIPIRAPILVIGYTFIELFSQFGGTRGNVAHFTHLAGFFFAFLYFVVRLRINPIRVFIDDMRS